MRAPRAPYMAKTDKERLATGFWNRNMHIFAHRNTLIVKDPGTYLGYSALTELGFLRNARTQ